MAKINRNIFLIATDENVIYNQPKIDKNKIMFREKWVQRRIIFKKISLFEYLKIKLFFDTLFEYNDNYDDYFSNYSTYNYDAKSRIYDNQNTGTINWYFDGIKRRWEWKGKETISYPISYYMAQSKLDWLKINFI